MGDLTAASFLGQLFSIEYVSIVVWYSLNLTWILYYFTYAGPIANDELFCRMVGYVGNGMPAVLALVVGNVIARWGWGFSTFCTSLMSIAMLLLSTLQILWLDYLALIFFSISRSMVFAVFFSYIPMTFGSTNYGRLIGVATLISGAFGFVNDPLSQWASFVHRPAASHCVGGNVCESAEACNRTSWAMAACLAPMLLYSVWLCGRSSGEERNEECATPREFRNGSHDGPGGLGALEHTQSRTSPDSPVIAKSETSLA